MKETFGVGCGMVFAVIAFVVLITGLVYAGDIVYTKYYEGWQMSQHTQNVHHSVGFVDGANERARDMIIQYQTAVKGNDPAHANSLHNDICGVTGNLKPDEVATDVAQFLAVHPCI